MSISAADLAQYVIKPTLEYLGIHCLAAEHLLLGTAAQQSDFDPFCQRAQGIGIYQISSEQHRSVWDDYLAYLPELASSIRGLASQRQFLMQPDLELKTNLVYSTAIAWAIYLQTDHPLPAADDAEGLSHFWTETFCRPDKSITGQARQFSQWIKTYAVAS